MKIHKTNAIRTLDKAHIQYDILTFDPDEIVVTTETALSLIKKEPCQVFKTLVTVAKSKQNYVFMLSIEDELNLKLAASIANEKSVEMLKSKELLPITGYIHGGCSPLGMKKLFPKFIDSHALEFESIICSAGKRGMMIELDPRELAKLISAKFAKLF